MTINHVEKLGFSLRVYTGYEGTRWEFGNFNWTFDAVATKRRVFMLK